jgi:hypothetical protein
LIGSGTLAPPPPITTWSPLSLPIGWVSLADTPPHSVAIAPLDPPPRWSFS